jgi:hypothetical protein
VSEPSKSPQRHLGHLVKAGGTTLTDEIGIVG